MISTFNWLCIFYNLCCFFLKLKLMFSFYVWKCKFFLNVALDVQLDVLYCCGSGTRSEGGHSQTCMFHCICWNIKTAPPPSLNCSRDVKGTAFSELQLAVEPGQKTVLVSRRWEVYAVQTERRQKERTL
jgi:hypothetical protein